MEKIRALRAEGWSITRVTEREMSGDATGDPWTHPGWCLMKSPSCHSREATVAAVAAWKDCKCSCKAILRCYNSDVIAHAHKYAQIIHMQSQSVVCVGSETFRETNHLIYIIQRSTMIYNVPFGATKSVISADLVDSQHYPFHVQYSTRLNHIAHPESASAWAATRTSGTQIGASMSSQASSKVMLFSSENSLMDLRSKDVKKHPRSSIGTHSIKQNRGCNMTQMSRWISQEKCII